MKPIFYASEVAALIGKNPYKSVEEALFRVVSAMPKWKATIETIKQDTGFQTEKEIVDATSATVKESIEKTVNTSLFERDVEKVITKFKKTVTTELLADALSGKEVAPEFKAAASRIAANESTIEQEAPVLQKSNTVSVLSREIQKQRGTRLESSAEDTFGGVTHRGDSARYETDNYILVGYIDGQKDGKIVETKNRKRFWKEPPPYDIIQLRCYMKMKGDIDGVLLECFPAHHPRETSVQWNPEIWQTIDSGLIDVVRRIEVLTASNIRELVDKNGSVTSKKRKD